MVEAWVEQVAWLTPTSLFLLLNFVIATILVSSAFTTHHKKHPPQLHQPEQNHHHDSGASQYTHHEYTTATATPTAPPPPAAPLVRTPSLFSRVTSFNFNNYYPYNNTYHDEHRNQHGELHGPTPSLSTRVDSLDLSGRAGPEYGAEEHGMKEKEPEPDVADANHAVSPAPAVAVVARSPSFLSRVASFTLGRIPQVEVMEDDSDARRNSIVFNKKFSDDDGGKKEKKVVKKKKSTARKETTTLKRVEGCEKVEVDAQADDFINRFKQQLKLQRLESLMRNRST